MLPQPPAEDRISRRAVLASTLVLASGSLALAQALRPLLIFAAASLQTALNAIARQWQQETAKRAQFSYAASSVLARQIDQGAPADVFISADLDWMGWADTRGLIVKASQRTLLSNQLVLIASSDTSDELSIAPNFPLLSALGDSRLAIGIPQSVPAGRYAQEALSHFGVWNQIAPRIAGVENVRTALALVARGEARFGIVYRSDARAEPKVRIVDSFPPSSHSPIIYAFAITTASTHPDAAGFLDYISKPAAQALFEAEGFSIRR